MTRAVRSVCASLLCCAVLWTAPPASADGVAVRLDLSAGVHNPPGPLLKRCDVTVPAGANAIAVLDAAVAAGCLGSYVAEYSAQYDDWYVRCIAFDGNDWCDQPMGAAFWAYYEDDVAPQDHGPGHFTAADGREVEFAYSSIALYPLCLTPVGC